MKIGFTGTRRGMTQAQRLALREIILASGMTEGRHGDCVEADESFHVLALMHTRAHLFVHPPSDRRWRAFCTGPAERVTVRTPRPCLERNRAIVAACELLIACPAEETEQDRGGTWYTFRQARALGQPCRLILPGGRVVEYAGKTEEVDDGW